MSKLIPIKLDGDGYSISVTQEAKAKKLTLLREAEQIHVVKDNDQAEVARYCLKELSEFSNLLEKSRKEVKEPVLEAGRKIDTAAKDFIKDVESQKARITTLISNHAREQEAIRQEAMRKQQEAALELQRKALEEERKRVAAERAALAAEQAILDASNKKERAAAQVLAEAARAKELLAEKARLEAEAAETREDQASMSVVAAAAPKGVKPSLDYEVLDARAFYKVYPHLCEITVKRRELLAYLKDMQDEVGGEVEDLPGIKVIETFKVSSR